MVNLFRTHTQVVTRPHRDDAEYVRVYVIDKIGGGVETELFDKKTGERVPAPRSRPRCRFIRQSNLADPLLSQQGMGSGIAKRDHAIDWHGVRDRVGDTRDHSRRAEAEVIFELNDVQK